MLKYIAGIHFPSNSLSHHNCKYFSLSMKYKVHGVCVHNGKFTTGDIPMSMRYDTLLPAKRGVA